MMINQIFTNELKSFFGLKQEKEGGQQANTQKNQVQENKAKCQIQKKNPRREGKNQVTKLGRKSPQKTKKKWEQQKGKTTS
jgi:hypothetical protein